MVSTLPDGTVIDADGVTVIDTREAEWERSDAFMRQSLRQVLARDQQGDAVITLRWLPAVRAVLGGHGHGGFHTAREHYFLLSGHAPQWDLEPGEPDELVVFRDGYFLDRRPGSIHASGSPPPQVGGKWLSWMVDGKDPYVGAREGASLTTESGGTAYGESPPPDPPAHQPADAFALSRPLVDIVDSRALDWEPHAHLIGASQRVLARRADGDPTIALTWIPPGSYPVSGTPYLARQEFREFMLVLAGELTVWERGASEQVRLREGFWVDRRPGSEWGLQPGEHTPSGCVFLRFAVRPTAVIIKDDEKNETWSRTTNPNSAGISPYADEEERQTLIARTRRDSV
jgi:hypothetical protein